jgi:acyl-CoA thioester hydrolase
VSPRIFVVDVPVRSYEVDFAGVVNNAVFVNYLEHGRMEIFRELGVPWETWGERGLTPVIRRLELDYHAPGRLLDRLRVESWVERLGRSSVHLGQRILRDDGSEDGTLLLEARVVGVFVGPDLRPVPIPEGLRSRLSEGEIGPRDRREER